MLDYASLPENVTAASDIWSLSVCLFHLASGQLPFENSTISLARKNLLNQAYVKPDVREITISPIRETISASFAAVIAKGLEYAPAKRFASALDMAMALHKCLVEQGSGVFSLFLSYYGPSDMIHALLLQNMLNCKITKGGNKVFVCMRPTSLGHAENWTGMSQGLVNSLMAVPILSSSMLDSMLELKGTEEDESNRGLLELTLMPFLKASRQSALTRIFPVHLDSVSCLETKAKSLIPRPSPPVLRAVQTFLDASELLVPQELLSLIQKSVKTSILDLLQVIGSQQLGSDQKEHATATGHENGDDDAHYEQLKAYISKEKLPPKDQIRNLASKLGFVADDICKTLDEVHSNLQHNQIQVNSGNPYHSQAKKIIDCNQDCTGKSDVVFCSAFESSLPHIAGIATRTDFDV